MSAAMVHSVRECACFDRRGGLLSSTAKIGREESKCSKTRDAHHLINAPTQDKFQLGIKGLAVPQQALSRQGQHNAERCATPIVVMLMLLITHMYTKGRAKIQCKNL